MPDQAFNVYSHSQIGSIEKGSQHKGLLVNRWQIFSWTFTWPGQDSLHWDQPSNLVVYSDGSWYIYAKHLANMRRTGGILDTGDYRTFLAAVTYMDKDKKVIGATDYLLAGLDYKQEVWDKDNGGVDSFVRNYEPEIQFASCTQWIR